VDGLVALVVVVVTDISERRRSALASHRLAAIVESSGDAIVSMDMAGTITSWNRGAEEILGSTAADMVGTSILQLVPPGRQEEEPTILEAITRGESVKQFETLRQTRDGRLIDVSITASPIKDATGAVVGVSKVTRDITERKQAATALREERERARNRRAAAARRSRRRRRRVSRAVCDQPAADVDLRLVTWRFLEVNDAAVQHYGYGRAEFLAMTIREIRPPEDVERLVADLDQAREPWLGPRAWRHRLKSGEVIDVEITSHTITFAGQTAALVVAQDITTRKRAEDAQRASETRYRTLFDYAPDGIVIADRNSYYLDANASICRMLGYTRDEFVGLHASDIVVPEEIRHIGSALRTIVGASDYQREWQFRRKDGSTFAADVIATSMPDGNLLAVIRDVTERNRSVEASGRPKNACGSRENAEVGIWDMDYATGALEWSTILEAQYGCGPVGSATSRRGWSCSLPTTARRFWRRRARRSSAATISRLHRTL
jgi:PAS domain S-box-containing protein